MSARHLDPKYLDQRDEAIREAKADGTSVPVLVRRYGLARSQIYNILAGGRTTPHPRSDRYVGPDRSEVNKAWAKWERAREGSDVYDAAEDISESLVDVEMPRWRTRAWETPKDTFVVYFVQAESGGPVKIGTSTLNSMRARLSSLQSGSPEKLVVRRLVLGGFGIEGKLHYRFVAQRIRGEWFKCTPELEKLLRPGDVQSDSVHSRQH